MDFKITIITFCNHIHDCNLISVNVSFVNSVASTGFTTALFMMFSSELDRGWSKSRTLHVRCLLGGIKTRKATLGFFFCLFVAVIGKIRRGGVGVCAGKQAHLVIYSSLTDSRGEILIKLHTTECNLRCVRVYVDAQCVRFYADCG